MSALIAWTDLVADAVATLSVPAAYAGSSFTETGVGSLANIRERTKANPAKLTLARAGTAPGGEIRFTGFVSQPKQVRLLAMLAANSVVRGLTVTVLLYSDAAWTTLVHTSPAFDYANAPVWGSSIGDDYTVLTQDFAVQSIAVRFVAPAPGSYALEIGRLWAGPAMMFPGMGRDWKAQRTDTSVVRITPHRVVTHSKVFAYRVLTAPMPRLTEAEAIGTNTPNSVCLDRMSYETGKGGSVIVLPRTSSKLYMRRLGIYGVLENDVDVAHVAGPYYKSSLVVGETG